MASESSAKLALDRLAEERRAWRKSHPVGFIAKPAKKAGGGFDLFHWTCKVPGKRGGLWEGGSFNVVLHFPAEYPGVPPTVAFSPRVFHANVYDSGKVCLDIINPTGWSPTTAVQQILIGLQTLLDEPNIDDPANLEAAECYRHNKGQYAKIIADEVARQPGD